MPHKPTNETYSEFQRAYDFLNEKLFASKLPPCLITLRADKKTYGYFWSGKFSHVPDEENTDEIAMNPEHFTDRSTCETLSTLAHEMCHLWQYHFGDTSRPGYHNKQWGSKMLEIGLQPSNTGQPGGKITGQKMSHYIVEKALFAAACKDLTDKGFSFSYVENPSPPKAKKAKRASKTKFTCLSCGANIWGKPETRVGCEACDFSIMESEELS